MKKIPVKASKCDTEIQTGVKIKEEPDDTTLNTSTTEDYKLVTNCSNLIDRDKSLSENDVPHKNVNNKENKLVSNSHSALDDVDKTVNLKHKNTKTRKKSVRDTASSPPKKKRKYFNEISKNEDSSTFCTAAINDFRRKRKQQSVVSHSNTKIQYTTRSTKKRFSAKCDICFREFSSLRNLECHKQYYVFIGDYKCKVCQERHATREKIHSHIMTHHHVYSVNNFTHHCNFCSRAFKHKELLQSHLFHTHSELIYSGNITKRENPRLRNVNTSREDDTLEANEESVHEENGKSLSSDNSIKSEKLNNTTLINNTNKSWDDDMMDTEKSSTEKTCSNEMSSTKKLRQPTLTEYLQLCKRRRDIKPSPNKLDMEDNSFMFASHYNGQTEGDLKPNLSEESNEVDSLPTTSSNLPGQMAHSILERSKKYDVYPSKKPFVKVHADVEMMKSFLEGLSDTIIKDNVEGQMNDTVSCDREVPYSLRSLRITSLVEANSNLGKRKNKNVSKKSQHDAECGTKTEQNMTDSNKVDSNFWKTVMVRFKCKDYTIPLTRCDEQPENHQISITETQQRNSMLFQESDIQNKMVLKEVEISLERLTAAPVTDIKVETVSEITEHKNDNFLCKVCNKSFSSKSAKRMHIKSSHIAYMSSICDARYALKHKLLQHYLHEHLFKSNQCCVCYALLSDYVALKRHLNVHCLKYIQREDDQYPIDIEIKCNSTKKAYKCLHCSKAFSSESILLVHQSCCTVQKNLEDQDSSIKEANLLSESILTIQCDQNTDEIMIICDEKIDDPPESSSNDSSEKPNECQISSVNEEDPKINEDNQDPSVNNVVEEVETVNEPQNSKKLSENDNSIISNKDIANAQLNVKSQDHIYPCDICGKQFHKRKNLEHHIRTFSDAVYTCPICGTGFSSNRLLQTHITAAHVPQISKTYSFHCMFCNQGFIKKHGLRPHVLHLHGQQMLDTLTHDSHANQEKSDESVTHTATCNVCNLVFETHDRYVEHRMYYHKNHTFTCSLCMQNFQGMYMFHHHNKLTHYSEDKRKSYGYICDICKEGFNHESHFHSHNMHVHSNEENSTEIAKEYEEGSRFAHTSEIQKIRNFPTNQRKQIEELPNEYTCRICQLKCIDAEDMAKHVIFYSNNGKFKCDKCNRRCRTANLLDQHKKLTHICRDIYNGHACHVCGEVLETITSLKCHEKHFHSNEIAYNKTNGYKNHDQTSSNIACNNKTVVKRQCESDNKVHNLVRYRYNCLFCDMKFSTANGIQTHIVQAHIDDLLAKQSTLKPLSILSIIDGDNSQKQFVQRLVETNQASSSASSSEDNPTQFLQRSDNIPNNTLAQNGRMDKTATKLSNQFKPIPIPILLKSNNKIAKNIPAIPLINKSKSNVSTPTITTLSDESKANTSVSLSTKSSNGSKSSYAIPLRSGSINKFKVNSVSSLNRSTDKSEIASVNPSSTGIPKSVIVAPQPRKNNGITDQKSDPMNANDRNRGYTCPLCPLEYPSLMFFHAHLKYAHADSIRTDMVSLQLNQPVQKTSTIECLLCPRIFIDEAKYKKHLTDSHTYYVYIPNSEEIAKPDNLLITQTNDNKRSTTPETITVDDDNDDINNPSDQGTDKVAVKCDSGQNDKIGKLRVKSFAKIIENLSTDCALKLLQSKQIVFHENARSENVVNDVFCIKKA